LDPILFSDELETTFSDVIQVDRIKSDHDATIAFFPIPYDLQTNYKRDVWLYIHAVFTGMYFFASSIYLLENLELISSMSFSDDKWLFQSNWSISELR
jgi:glutamate/tyrosine decarboxylase-like PLP-dependent enzyme